MQVRQFGDKNDFMISGLSNVCLLLGTGLRYYPLAKKCKLDSPWMGPYLVVSLEGWAVGVQLHPDSPILIIHCQDLKKIPLTRGLVSWIDVHSPASLPTCWVLVLCVTLRRGPPPPQCQMPCCSGLIFVSRPLHNILLSHYRMARGCPEKNLTSLT